MSTSLRQKESPPDSFILNEGMLPQMSNQPTEPEMAFFVNDCPDGGASEYLSAYQLGRSGITPSRWSRFKRTANERQALKH
jgi:hypothetical protein